MEVGLHGLSERSGAGRVKVDGGGHSQAGWRRVGWELLPLAGLLRKVHRHSPLLCSQDGSRPTLNKLVVVAVVGVRTREIRPGDPGPGRLGLLGPTRCTPVDVASALADRPRRALAQAPVSLAFAALSA